MTSRLLIVFENRFIKAKWGDSIKSQLLLIFTYIYMFDICSSDVLFFCGTFEYIKGAESLEILARNCPKLKLQLVQIRSSLYCKNASSKFYFISSDISSI